MDRKIAKIIVHTDYKSPKKYFDVALFELELPVVSSKFVQPACLYIGSDVALVGQTASLTGWGVVETGI
jgi:hypothetical protein